jgi:hypothetical protein
MASAPSTSVSVGGAHFLPAPSTATPRFGSCIGDAAWTMLPMPASFSQGGGELRAAIERVRSLARRSQHARRRERRSAKWSLCALTAVAIVNNYIMMQPLNPVKAIVVSDNNKPRNLFNSLGFNLIQEHTAIHQPRYTGLEHMTADEHGMIYIDVYEQTKTGLINTMKNSLKRALGHG